MKKLVIQAIGKFTLGALLLMLLLFLPAGTPDWRQGWLFLAILLIPMFCAGILMLFVNPRLLRSRLEAKETQSDQKQVIRLSGGMFLLGFVLAGLNFRYGWLPLPSWVSWVGTAVFLISYVLYGEVLRENVWLSRTIEVQQGQQVVDTGLYGIVRHPMYAVTVFLFLSIPLVLGSLPTLLVFLIYPYIMAKRIRGEEAFLEQALPGYRDYQKKVRYRLVPYLW